MDEHKFTRGLHPQDYKGTTILVLGICGVTICGLCAPIAWSMGTNAIKQMEGDHIYDGSEYSSANVGRILGIVGTVFVLLALIVVFLAQNRR